jgi:3-phenylpropionate/trans-cinnamate dioxygenase ferredoxin reductase subunit
VLRERGFEGPLTLIGDEAHPPYERPPLSKDGLAAQGGPPRTITTAEALAGAGIDFRPSARAVSIDRHTQTVLLGDGTELAYGRLVLATGASPRRLPLAEGSAHCLYLRTHDDAASIGARLRRAVPVVIVGGGFIGLEIAAAARGHGCPVIIVEAQPRLLMRGVPAEIAAAIDAEHRAHGVTILTGAGIASIEDDGDTARVGLSDGSTLTAGLVVIGIGAVPDVTLAEKAGLTLDNGVAVDAHLVSSDPAIMAVGDCASFPLGIYGGRRVRLESWRNTQDHAAVAAANLMGEDVVLDAVPWFWSDQYGLGLQVAGLVDEAKTTVRRDLGGGAFILFGLDAEGRLVAASGIGPGNVVARDVRLAEMLISRRAHPDPAALASPGTKLKALLAA